MAGVDGNFYGTTTAGGTTNAGVIYRITPAGVFSVVIEFDNVHTLNGYQAYAGLIAGADGKLYGATIWGGTSGYGVIFSLTTFGTYSVLYNFSAPGGDGAYATPMQHTSGTLFGMTNRGGTGSKGVVYSFNDSFKPFIQLTTSSGAVGTQVGILGRGLSKASSVEFNGALAAFQIVSDTYITATVPSGETGEVVVFTSSGQLSSNKVFRVTPKLTGISPLSGKAGSTVAITGSGLIQTEDITVGGIAVNSYTVNSDSKLTILLSSTAKTGKIQITTPGGQVTSGATFTVTP